MKINTKATNISITPEISEYIEKKVQMLEKFFANIDDVLVNVEVGKTTKHHKSGDVFRAEIKINANGEEYYTFVESDDLYASIDKVKDEIGYSLSSNKKKSLRMIRKGGQMIKNMMKGFVDMSKKSLKRFKR